MSQPVGILRLTQDGLCFVKPSESYQAGSKVDVGVCINPLMRRAALSKSLALTGLTGLLAAEMCCFSLVDGLRPLCWNPQLFPSWIISILSSPSISTGTDQNLMVPSSRVSLCTDIHLRPSLLDTHNFPRNTRTPWNMSFYCCLQQNRAFHKTFRDLSSSW